MFDLSQICYTFFVAREIINCNQKNMYKFKIIKNKKGEFRAQFCFRKEVIFWTENYTRKPSAKKAIESLIKNAATATMEEVDENMPAMDKKTAAPKAKSTKKKTSTTK